MSDKQTLGSSTRLPENFDALDEFWEFWDEHSSADYEEFMEAVEVEIGPFSKRLYCAIAKDVLLQVRDQARQQGVSTETLVNLWLQEKLTEAEQLTP